MINVTRYTNNSFTTVDTAGFYLCYISCLFIKNKVATNLRATDEMYLNALYERAYSVQGQLLRTLLRSMHLISCNCKSTTQN